MDDIEVLGMIIQVLLVIAASCVTLFPVLYSFYPWKTTKLGRILMFQGIAFAWSLDLTVLFQFWLPDSILLLFWIQAVSFAMIALATSLLTWKMWVLNRRRRAGDPTANH